MLDGLTQVPDGSVLGLGEEDELRLRELVVLVVPIPADQSADAGDLFRQVGGGEHDLPTDLLPAFNAEFAQPAMEAGTAFVPWIGGRLDDTLCEQYERTVSADNRGEVYC